MLLYPCFHIIDGSYQSKIMYEKIYIVESCHWCINVLLVSPQVCWWWWPSLCSASKCLRRSRFFMAPVSGSSPGPSPCAAQLLSCTRLQPPSSSQRPSVCRGWRLRNHNDLLCDTCHKSCRHCLSVQTGFTTLLRRFYYEYLHVFQGIERAGFVHSGQTLINGNIYVEEDSTWWIFDAVLFTQVAFNYSMRKTDSKCTKLKAIMKVYIHALPWNNSRNTHAKCVI